MCIAGNDGFFKKVNAAFVETLGYSEEELISIPYVQFVHPDDLKATEREAARLSAGEKTITFENRYRCKNGEYRWLSWKCTPHRGALYAIARDITSYNAIKQALHESETRMKTILDNAPVIFFMVDSSGKIQVTSGRSLARIEENATQIEGQNIFVGIEKEEPGISEYFKKALAGEITSAHISFRGATFDVRFAPVFDQNGQIVETVGVAVDITEQKLAEAQLSEISKRIIREEAEQKFRETFEHAGIGLAHAQLDGTLSLVNDELCAMLGYEKNDLIHTNYYELLGPSDVRTSEVQKQALANGEVSKIVRERHLVKKDGSHFWALVTVSIVRNEQNEVKYYILAHKDITKRKAIEAALKESEKSFRCLVEAIPQIVWTATPEGVVDFYNQRWYDYTGLNPEESKGGGWDSVIHPDDLQECLDSWSKAVETGESYEAEYRFLNGKNRTYRWQLGRALPLHDENGNIIKWFGTCTDIDDQKRTQEQLRLSLRQIKRSSEEKTRLLTNERVAIEGSRLKSEFLANMTHEIRTPLNGVIAMARMLLGMQLSKDQKECADIIVRSADDLLAIVNDILDLTKIEAGKMSIETVNFDLVELINSVVNIMSVSARNKGITLSCTFSRECPRFVLGDPSRIRQVLNNLIQNAVKFTSSGSIQVKVRTTHLGDCTESLTFEVIDTGIGIEPSALGRIWNSFEQADASVTRKYGGTGLGLSICKRIVELIGGKVSVESQAGVGSKFWFEIPLKKGHEIDRARVKTLPRELIVPSHKSKSSTRILVAEDHSTNQKVIRKLIEKMGYSVDVVANGKEAVTAVCQESYDVVLMDCHMPEMDGFTATKTIRQSSNTRVSSVPIIALTADVLRGTKSRCLEAGMSHFLTKPIDSKLLASTLDDLLTTTSQPISAPPVIDPEAIEKLRSLETQGTLSFIGELISDFLKKTPAQIRKIEMAIRKLDHKSIEEEAHSLKSASAMIGAIRLSEACRELETIAIEQGPLSEQHLTESAKSLKKTYLETKLHLRKIVSNKAA